MEEATDQANILLNTKGKCFFCLEKSDSYFPAGDKDELISSINFLTTYLKLDLVKVTRENLKGKVNVVVCERCLELSESFGKLYEQLEKIKLEVLNCLDEIKSRFETGDLGVGIGRIAGKVRREVAEKCFLFTRKNGAHVRLHRLSSDNSGSVSEVASAVKFEANEDPDWRDYASFIPETELNEDPVSPMPSPSAKRRIPTLKGRNRSRVKSQNICDICGKTFRKPFLLKQHQLRHTAATNPTVKPFICDICGKSFGVKDNYQSHLRNIHENRNKYSCTHCNKAFPKQSALDCHVASRHTSSSQADVKNESDSNTPHPISPIIVHNPITKLPSPTVDEDLPSIPIIKKKRGRKPRYDSNVIFRCHHCPRQFKERPPLRRHIKCVHLNIRNDICDLCGKTFSRRFHLLVHKKTCAKSNPTKLPSSDKLHPYTCHICKKGISNAHNLKNHISRMHTNREKYPCDLCWRKFPQPSMLKYHQEKSHRIKLGNKQVPEVSNATIVYLDDESTPKPSSEETTLPKVFPCTMCDKQYKHQSTLCDHIKDVHEKTIWPCSICNKSFKSSSNLKYHKRSCGPNKPARPPPDPKKFPFLCSFCGKGFPHKNNLQRHTKLLHLDKDKYVCPEVDCGKAFSKPSVLKRHHDKDHLGVRFHCVEPCNKNYSTKGDWKKHVEQCNTYKAISEKGELAD